MLVMCRMIVKIHIVGAFAMRTNIVIDEGLMKRAMRASGARTKREAVERAVSS
jgi:Arc/MetJ family transcription regulator